MKEYLSAVQFLHDLDAAPRVAFHPTVDEHGIRNTGAGLNRMKLLLEYAGHPERGLPIVNVTGTSGKGSVTKMVHSIYHAAGRRVGSFTSPRLTTEADQIEVGSALISAEEFVALAEWAKPYIEKVTRNQENGPPSSFEVLTLMALKYFQDQKCDLAILEAGLGGSYDATNIAETQVAVLLTHVALDHTDTLGATKELIARDKVGLLKSGSRLITTEKDPAIVAILERHARRHDAIFFPITEQPHILTTGIDGSRFGFGGITVDLHVGGSYQIENAMLAYSLASMLGLDRTYIERGLSEFFIPGRSEIMGRAPYVLLSGGHNPDKIGASVRLCEENGIRNVNVIFGAMKDKNIPEMLSLLRPITQKLYLTKLNYSPRPAAEPEKLMTIAQELSIPAVLYNDVFEAYEAAHTEGPVLACGSLYLVGELRKRWFTEEGILEHRAMLW